MSENYKGQLQTVCAQRELASPTYHTTRDGRPHSPAWHVTVSYGDQTYVTETPIAGTKKHAEHVAAKQVLVLLGERLPTNASESVVIETLFAVWDLLKARPHAQPKGIAETLGISHRAAVRYLKYAEALQSRVSSETEPLHQRIQELEAENAEFYELLK